MVDESGQRIDLRSENFNYNPDAPDASDLSAQFLAENADTLENVRLLDPAIVSPTFSRLEVERDQFSFAQDLDVDRYVIDGEQRTVVVAARELNLGGVREGWENQHVSFTHGYGLAIAPANTVTDEGEPDFLVGGLPTAIDDSINVGLGEGDVLQPRIYIGEGLGGYAIVRTDRCEVDFPLQGGASTATVEDTPDVAVEDTTIDDAAIADCGESGSNQEFYYDGNDGVEAGGFLRRAAFALRFQDLNPIFSGLINDESRFIYNRDVGVRARELAPFLEFDADSYPAIIDGRIVFIIDAYTTTDNYPYSQSADRSSLPPGSDLRGSFNYVRNSVKVVVDAYNGDVDFFVVDEADPIIRAYQKAFPDLFKSRDDDEFTAQLIDHLRYPEDLFRIQTNMWATYQLTQPESFFDDTAAWTVALDPGSELESTGASQTTSATGLPVITTGDRIPPYYQQMRLPGLDEQEFVLLRPFVPSSRSGELRQELTAFMVARIDDEGRQSLRSYTVPGTAVDGPVLANAAMLNNPTIAARTTLLGSTGSSVRLGNMLLLPLDTPDGDERIVYVRPLYVDAQGDLPLLRLVIVADDDTVRMCPTLELALGALFVPEAQLDEDCNGVTNPLTGELIEGIDDSADPEPDEPDAPAETPDPTPTPAPQPTPTPSAPIEPPPADVQALLEEAQARFDEAAAALADGDLGRYQELIDEAGALLDDALSRIDAADGAGAEAVPTPTPPPTPTPTPTPQGA